MASQSDTGWLNVVNLTFGEGGDQAVLGGGQDYVRVRGRGAAPFVIVLEVTEPPAGDRSVVLFAARVRFTWLGLRLTAESTEVWLVHPVPSGEEVSGCVPES